jgi:hypothetical protein
MGAAVMFSFDPSSVFHLLCRKTWINKTIVLVSESISEKLVMTECFNFVKLRWLKKHQAVSCKYWI